MQKCTLENVEVWIRNRFKLVVANPCIIPTWELGLAEVPSVTKPGLLCAVCENCWTQQNHLRDFDILLAISTVHSLILVWTQQWYTVGPYYLQGIHSRNPANMGIHKCESWLFPVWRASQKCLSEASGKPSEACRGFHSLKRPAWGNRKPRPVWQVSQAFPHIHGGHGESNLHNPDPWIGGSHCTNVYIYRSLAEVFTCYPA